MSRFSDKIVIITGTIGGIGLATAMRFINEGAKVVVIGRGPQSVGDVQKRMKI
jgi:meso-butanediol dehydrogenase/(S,S)-butanediol dehydrogenase/diacetyl reductase